MASRKTRESAIPVGTQFTPELVDLSRFVACLITHSGDKDAIEDSIWTPGVRLKPKAARPTKRTRSLPVEAAVQYGLLSKVYEATDLSKHLATLTGKSIFDEFAKHILLRCGGLRVLEGIEQMRADSLKITGDSLAQFLTDQGFNVSVHNTAINSLRMWLAKGDLFQAAGKGADAWAINRPAKERLLGLDDEAIELLSGLGLHQLAFIEALCAIGPKSSYLASEVRNLAMARRPEARFDKGSLPNDILEPLREIGIIEYTAGGTSGGKSSTLTITPKFRSDILERFVTDTVKTMDAVVSGYFKRRPEDIYADLDSSDSSKKGRALEALAVRVMRILGLRFVEWRVRAPDKTGQAEVDAVFAGVIGAVPSRWQIQCKNTPGSKTDLEDVAKEVGLVPITRATHLLVLSTGGFTADAVRFAEQVTHNSAITIFLLGRSEYDEIRKDDAALGRILRNLATDSVKRVTQGSLFAWK